MICDVKIFVCYGDTQNVATGFGYGSVLDWEIDAFKNATRESLENIHIYLIHIVQNIQLGIFRRVYFSIKNRPYYWLQIFTIYFVPNYIHTLYFVVIVRHFFSKYIFRSRYSTVEY